MNPNIIKSLSRVTKDSSLYITMVQDFMSLNNYGGFLTVIGIYEDPQEALRALYSQGQREPGLVVEVITTNAHMLSLQNRHTDSFLDEYEVSKSDLIILSDAPTEFVPDRFGICEVLGSDDKERRMQGAKIVFAQKSFSLLGRIYEIADAEHGPYNGIKKIEGRFCLKGIG